MVGNNEMTKIEEAIAFWGWVIVNIIMAAQIIYYIWDMAIRND
jgi:hypothetical protein